MKDDGKIKMDEAARRESAIAERIRLVMLTQALSWVELASVVNEYASSVGQPDIANEAQIRSGIGEEETDYFPKVDRERYPAITLQQEAVFARVVEDAKTPPQKVLAEKASEYLIGGRLGWIFATANGFDVPHRSVSKDDLMQKGCLAVIEHLKDWDWKESAFTTYFRPIIHSAMYSEILFANERTHTVDRRLRSINILKSMWLEVKGDNPSNDDLAKAMVLNHLRPDQKTSNKEIPLREGLVKLAEDLNIFSEKRRSQSAESLIDLARERMDYYEELASRSNIKELDSPLDEGNNSDSVLDILGSDTDRSHLDESRITKFNSLVDDILGKLPELDQKVIRFYYLQDKGQRKSLKELGDHLGVNEAKAKKALARATRKFRNTDKMATRNLRLFALDENLID